MSWYTGPARCPIGYGYSIGLACHPLPDGVRTVGGSYETLNGGWIRIGNIAPEISPNYLGIKPHGEVLSMNDYERYYGKK